MLINQDVKSPLLVHDLGKINHGSKGLKYWFGIYQCPKCMNNFKAMVYHVRSGHTSGCIKCRNSKGSVTKNKFYHIWENMKQRCTNKNAPSYKHYGARGISICGDWMNSTSFIEWANSSGYKEGLTLDRIDVNGNYEPSNCRWVDKNTQARNTRPISSNNTSGYRGVYYHKKSNKWMASLMINDKPKYLGLFATKEEAHKTVVLFVSENKLEHNVI